MAGRQAKIITAAMLHQMLTRTAQSPTPERDRVILLLSVKGGLRACEIAGLEWSMVLDAQGGVGASILIEDRIVSTSE